MSTKPSSSLSFKLPPPPEALVRFENVSMWFGEQEVLRELNIDFVKGRTHVIVETAKIVPGNKYRCRLCAGPLGDGLRLRQCPRFPYRHGGYRMF